MKTLKLSPLRSAAIDEPRACNSRTGFAYNPRAKDHFLAFLTVVNVDLRTFAGADAPLLNSETIDSDAPSSRGGPFLSSRDDRGGPAPSSRGGPYRVESRGDVDFSEAALMPDSSASGVRGSSRAGSEVRRARFPPATKMISLTHIALHIAKDNSQTNP